MKIGAILDIQHAGRASRPGDQGAAFDLDGDNVIEDAEHEVALAGAYAMAAAAYLRPLVVQVLMIHSGEYWERHAQAIAWAQEKRFDLAAYVACHVNAGRGLYGLVVHDYRSKAGNLLAACIAQDLGPFVPPLSVVHVAPTAEPGVDVAPDIPGLQESNYPRAWTCLHGIGDRGSPRGLCGVVFEPGFIDQPKHVDMWGQKGLDDLGRCLGHGIHRYLTQPIMPPR
jgi:hypothetical protein